MFDEKLYELIYAALLHDIGKVENRTGRNIAHEVLSVQLLRRYYKLFEKVGLDPETIADLIICHHKELRSRKEDSDLVAKCLELEKSIGILLDKLIRADHDSAPERTLGDDALAKTGEKAFTEKLVSPLWIKDYYLHRHEIENIDEYIQKVLMNSRICYRPAPLTVLSRYFKNPEKLVDEYSAVLCRDESSNTEYYERILSDLKDKLDRLLYLADQNILDRETLLSTLMNYIKYSLLLVPDATWGVKIPSTSLAVHQLLTAALASSYYLGEGKIRLATIDLSGIQKYIASYARTTGALRQLRGRSLILQLITHAAAHYILDAMDLPPVHLVLLRGDNAVFILPDKIKGRDTKELFEKAVREVERTIYELFHGDLYIAATITEPFEISYIPPWSREYGRKGVSKAFIELGEKLDVDKMKKYSRLSIAELESHIATGSMNRLPGECQLCRSTIFQDKLVRIKNTELEEELGLFNIDYVCPACLLSHIAGVAAENLVFIIEVANKEITDALYKELLSGKIPVKPSEEIRKKYRFGIVPLKGLNRTYILVSYKTIEDTINELDEWDKLLDFLIKFIIKSVVKTYIKAIEVTEGKKKEIRVNVMKVNDPFHFIPKLEKLSKILPTELTREIQVKYGFTSIFTNFSMMGINDLDKLAEKDNGETTYLSWIKIDIDKMGETGLYMIGSIGRYITFAELVNFYTNMMGHLILRCKAKHVDGRESIIGKHGIIIFSGGDDTFLVSRFIEGLYYLLHYHNWFEKFFGKTIHGELLTVSAGCLVKDYKYPAYLAYKQVLGLLEQAKDEGRNRVRVSILSIPSITIEPKPSKMPRESLEWKDYKDILVLSTDNKLVEFVKRYKLLAYKLNQLFEDIYILLNYTEYSEEKDKHKYEKRLTEKIITYAYLYNKQPQTTKKELDTYLQYITEKLGINNPHPETLIELMVKNNIEKAIKSIEKTYRLTTLQLLRIKEEI